MEIWTNLRLGLKLIAGKFTKFLRSDRSKTNRIFSIKGRKIY